MRGRVSVGEQVVEQRQAVLAAHSRRRGAAAGDRHLGSARNQPHVASEDRVRRLRSQLHRVALRVRSAAIHMHARVRRAYDLAEVLREDREVENGDRPVTVLIHVRV